MRVAEAILSEHFLDGTMAIEYVRPALGPISPKGYDVHQVTVVRPVGELPFMIERHRNFAAELSDPWPRWMVTRGSVCCTDGFGGVWLPQLSVLITECKLVALTVDDRVPPVKWLATSSRFSIGEYVSVTTG
jgi:hypothetical protein